MKESNIFFDIVGGGLAEAQYQKILKRIDDTIKRKGFKNISAVSVYDPQPFIDKYYVAIHYYTTRKRVYTQKMRIF